MSDSAANGSAENGAAPRDAADLVRMINQIAANVAHHPRDRAVAEVAAHVRASWAPAMRGELDAYLDRGAPDLSPLAAAAAEELRAETTRSSPA